MTAALVSSLEGLEVLLCEKSDRVGGTTATSAGTIWVPGTRQAREAGSTDEIVDAKRYLDAVIGAATDPRRDAYLETGPRVVDYLEQRTEVKFAPYARHPDYLVNRPGAVISGRALAPLPFDGRLLGADFELVRPPIGEFMALGGMMIGRDDIEPLARPFASLTAFRAVSRCCGGTRPIGCAIGAAPDSRWAMHWSPGCSTACAATACRSGATRPCKS
jgi:hypothetical protein